MDFKPLCSLVKSLYLLKLEHDPSRIVPPRIVEDSSVKRQFERSLGDLLGGNDSPEFAFVCARSAAACYSDNFTQDCFKKEVFISKIN